MKFDDNGLAPAIVQDAATGRVLMLGYVNEESLRLTQETGRVHLWSRSRRALWRKGATSGNTLDNASVAVDCDDDAVLITATPAGPTCHEGTVSCFTPSPTSLGELGHLERTIESRLRHRPDKSYTVGLVDGGPEATGRKVMEEALELILAAKDHQAGKADDRRVAEEAADLVYHMAASLAERGIGIGAVMDILAERAEDSMAEVATPAE